MHQGQAMGNIQGTCNLHREIHQGQEMGTTHTTETAEIAVVTITTMVTLTIGIIGLKTEDT